jgi:hypothetical protein|tara:strand:+ start:134 stop:271 length:138 start_codon:yes stop_codon:yes gene_type:complete
MVMNDWNKIEKKKRMATESDLIWENVKMIMMVLIAIVYLYFVFKS